MLTGVTSFNPQLIRRLGPVNSRLAAFHLLVPCTQGLGISRSASNQFVKRQVKVVTSKRTEHSRIVATTGTEGKRSKDYNPQSSVGADC
jgi:hypothetical protein